MVRSRRYSALIFPSATSALLTFADFFEGERAAFWASTYFRRAWSKYSKRKVYMSNAGDDCGDAFKGVMMSV